MRITRGSNFHDEEQQLGAQSGVKQGSLKRRGSGFVSTVTPLSSLPAYPRVLEESLFSMTIEFRCAKVRRKKSRNRFPPDIESSPSSLVEESPDSARLSSFLSLSSVSFVTKSFVGSGELGVSQKSLVFGEVGSRKTPLPLSTRHSRRKAVR